MGYSGYGHECHKTIHVFFFYPTMDRKCPSASHGDDSPSFQWLHDGHDKKKTHLDWFEVGLKIYWKQRWFFPVQKEDVPAFPSSLGNAVCRGQTCPNGFLKVGKWWYAKTDTKTIEITCSISFRLTKNHGMKSGCQFGEPLQVASKRRLSQPREIAPKTHRSSNCQLQGTNSAIAHHGSHQQCSVFQTCAAQPTGKTYALRRKAHATAKGLSGWRLGKIEPGSRRLKTNGTWRIL